MTQRNRSEKTALLVCAEDVHLQLFVVLLLVCGYLTENVTHIGEVCHDVTPLHTASRTQIPVDSGAAATVV